MKRVNVVWCDDNIDTLLTESVLYSFERHNCHLFKKAKTSKELKAILEEYKRDIDAVIVDFNMGESEKIPAVDSASGFRWVHEHMKEYKPIPFYLYSARDYDFIKEKYTSFEFKMEGDYFFTPNKSLSNERNRYFQPGELEQLLEMIGEEVEKISTPEFKIRNEFSKAFATLERFNLDSNVFMQILLSDENVDRYDLLNRANPIRMVLEEMVSKLETDGIVPTNCDFNSIPYLFHGKDKNSIVYSSQHHMHKSLFEAYQFLVAYTQDGSHNKNYLNLEFHDYLRTSRDIYIVKSLAIIALDVVSWMGWLHDEYKDIKPFDFTPFRAKVIEIKVVEGHEGAIVKDSDGLTYFVVQPKNPKYKFSVGNNIEVTQRSPTKPEYGNFYAFGRNLDKSN